MKYFLKYIKVLSAVLLAGLAMGMQHTGFASETGPEMHTISSGMVGKKVLLVHSYHREHPWVANVEAGVRAVLDPAGVRVKSVYMDTKRRPDETSRILAGQRARQVAEELRPDVIIASDDNAQEYFAKQYAGIQEAPGVVFCAVNADPAVYGYPADNVAGVVERIFFERSLHFLREIVPEVHSMLVLSDDSPSSQAALAEMRAQQVDLDRILWKSCRTVSEWKDTLLSLQGEVDAVALLNYHVLKGDDGRQAVPDAVMAWTADNLLKPSIGFHSFTIAEGGLCGIVQSGFEHGYRSGTYAIGMLNGRSAREFGTAADLLGMVMFNRKAARKIGIRVPASVEVLTDGVIE